MKRILQTAFLCIIILSTGCGTVNRDKGLRSCGGSHGVYKATTYDMKFFAVGTVGAVVYDLPVLQVPIAVGCLVDLPISLATDTILLPFDVVDLSRYNKEQKAKEEEAAAKAKQEAAQPKRRSTRNKS